MVSVATFLRPPSGREPDRIAIKEPTSTVVPLTQKTRTESPGSSDLRNPVVQLELLRRLDDVWGRHLTMTEFRLMSFIMRHTIGWSRPQHVFSYRFMEHGDQLTVGTGISRTQLYETLRSLERIGLVTVDHTDKTRGFPIRPNIHWKPEADVSSIPVPKRLQDAAAHSFGSPENDDGWAKTGSDFRTTPVRETEPLPFGSPNPIKEPILEQYSVGEKVLSLAADATAMGQDEFSTSAPVPVRMRQRPPRTTSPEKETPPPVAAAPSPEKPALATEADLFPEHVRQDAPAKGDKRKSLKPVALEQTMQRAFVLEYTGTPGAFFQPWTEKQRHMLRASIIKRWPKDQPELCHQFFEWLVADWFHIRIRHFSWMKKNPAPAFPEIGFIINQRATLVPAFHGRERDNWLSSLPDAEQRRYLTLTQQEGKTEEEARMIMAEERAREKMREENAKAKAAANSAWRKAQIRDAEASRKLRRSAEPHPQSQAAIAQRRAELLAAAPPLPDDAPLPDLAQFADIPFREDDQ